jgi:hypothetical protein
MGILRKLVMAMLIGVGVTACAPKSDVKIVPPKVPQGGRAVAIAASQSDAKRLIVASESGGLFRTFDGGLSFQHLDGFPTLYAVDVVMASLDPNIVIATARDDFATTSGAGIWRSADGGASWKRPIGWPPAGCGGRPRAAGISHMPLSRTFHVATDCGLAVSNDNGASFTTTPIDPANPMLFSVLVVNRTTGVAADNRRTWFLNNGQWTPSFGGPDDGSLFTPHAFASPWWAAANIFYHAGRDRNLWVSATGGGAWLRILTVCDALPDGCGNREAFVRAGRGLDGDPTHFDVYYGDGENLWRQGVTTVVPGGNPADWRKPDAPDHPDPADIAFTPGFEEPLMLATDHGVHLTKDQGRRWTLTGSNVGGYVALQVGEVTGRQVGGSSPHLDLYYGTQDNDIKGSRDGGATWNGSRGGEGAFLQVDRANPAMVDGRVTGRRSGKPLPVIFDVQPHLGQNDSGRFRNAPNGSTGDADALAPFQLVGYNYLQPLNAPPNTEYWLTGNRGASWARSFTIAGKHVGPVHFAGDLANPVAYVALEKGPGSSLMRASAVSGAPVVRAADQIGMGTIGLLSTAQARYPVVGVDPKEPDHLLAHDIFAGTKASRDGGINWFALPALDAAVSDSGKYKLSNNSVPFVTTIAWDPTNSCHILVGTMQNGVIRSADGGLTWARVPGSQHATIVTSFFFPPAGPIWMSTYGRGLWQVTSDRAPPASGRCEFPRPGPSQQPSPSVVIMQTGAAPRAFSGLQDEVVCATCSVLLVHDGWITDIAGDYNIRSIATSGGYVEQRQPNGRETAATVRNSVRENESNEIRSRRGGGVADERRLRGLILDGSRLVAYIAGVVPPAITPLRKPAVFVRTMPDDTVQMLGFQFLPGSGDRGVTVTTDGDAVATNLTVTADGKFEARLHVQRPPGWVLVSAVQRDGLRTTIATTYVQVVDDK